MTEAIVHTIELRVRVVLELVPMVLPAPVVAAPAAPEKPAPEKEAPEKPAPEKPAAEKAVPENPAVAPPAPPPPVHVKPAASKAPAAPGGATRRAARPAINNAASAEQRQRALAAYERGATFAEAAREAGVSAASIANWVREAGMAIRPGSWRALPAAAAEAPASPPEAPREVERPSPPAVATVPAPAPVTRPVPPPATVPSRAADDAAVAAALGAGLVTRVPDATAFAKLPAIVDAAQAIAVLESAGVQARRQGGGWDVGGRKVDFVGLVQAAQAEQRKALLQGAGAAAAAAH